MSKEVARSVLQRQLEELRRFPYASLARMVGRSETKVLDGSDGTRYQVEIEAHWDDAEGGDVRVIVAVDDGGWRAYAPLNDSFIMSPAGRFVGE